MAITLKTLELIDEEIKSHKDPQMKEVHGTFDSGDLMLLRKAQPEIISEINLQMGKNHGQYLYEYAILDYELPLHDRNEIARQYVEEGWNYVYHRTTSENNERYGLTVFYFSIVPIDTLCRIYRATKDEILHIDDSHQIDRRLWSKWSKTNDGTEKT